MALFIFRPTFIPFTCGKCGGEFNFRWPGREMLNHMQGYCKE